MTPQTPTILSTIMNTRSSIPFLHKAAKTALKVDANHHCVVDVAFDRNAVKETPARLAAMGHRPDLKAVLHNAVGNSACSVIFSWPVDGSLPVSRQHNEAVQNWEGALRESHPNVTTTKPFFMLDGGGQRMASLAVLRNNEDAQTFANFDLGPHLCEDTSDYDHETPGMRLRHYSSLRKSASS